MPVFVQPPQHENSWFQQQSEIISRWGNTRKVLVISTSIRRSRTYFPHSRPNLLDSLLRRGYQRTPREYAHIPMRVVDYESLNDCHSIVSGLQQREKKSKKTIVSPTSVVRTTGRCTP
ncbi:unnamed protein product, partial [Ectocarpus sp. 6 AP-2014]